MPVNNPYAEIGDSFTNLTRNLIALKGQEMQNALSTAELAMRGNQFQETQRQNDLQNFGMTRDQVQPGMKTLHARQIANAEEATRLHRAQLPIGQTDYSPTKHTRVMATLKNRTGLSSSLDKLASTRLLPFANDPNARMDDVYDNISAMTREDIAEILTDVANEHESKLAKDPNYGKTRQAKATETFMDALYQAQDGSQLAAGFMPEVSRGREELKAKMQADALKAAMTDELKEYMFAVRNQGEKRTFTDWKAALKRAGSTRLSVTNNVGPRAMTKVGEEQAVELVKERKDVQGAVDALNNLDQAEALMNSGMITGSGAEYLVNMGNFLSSRLGMTFSEDPVANTQAYAATMGNQVGQIIKQFGSGTGLSDADREYAEKIVGGKITLNEKALRKLHEINRKAYENVIANYNRKADQTMRQPGADMLPYDLRVDYKPKRRSTDKQNRPPLSSFQR
jgi:hypothetical protein